MTTSNKQINNFFGDMDLFLMDAILKGHVSVKGSSVLDVGCGEGRNGLYFMQEGYNYFSWDTDNSKIKLIEYLATQNPKAKVSFENRDLRIPVDSSFDLVICSRVLHFAESNDDFEVLWTNLKSLVRRGGLLYLSMDSIVDSLMGEKRGELIRFPDGKLRFALSESLYNKMKKGFEEIEPLKTMTLHGQRAQSFALLRKV